MRMHGDFIHLGGLIFKNFNQELNVIPPFDIPTDWNWSRFRGLDHGLNNPTACVWVAVNREDEYYIYDEYYEEEKTIEENAFGVKQISGADKYEWSSIDGSTRSRQASDRQSYYDIYKKHEYIAKPVFLNKDNTRIAIDATNGMLRVNEKTKKPKLFIFDTCYSTIKEFSRFKWKTFRGSDIQNKPDKPQEFLNHAITAWFFVLLSKARWVSPMEDVQPQTVSWYGR